MRQFTEAVLLYLLTLPVSVLPLPLAQTLGRALGRMAFWVWRSRRRIAIENVKSAIKGGSLPRSLDPYTTALKNFENLGMSLLEIVKIYHGFGKSLLNRVTIEGYEYLEKPQKEGRGILFITGHCGNWELLALTASYRVTPIRVVARRLNNPYLNLLVERTRKKYGNRVIYKEGALKEIIKALRNSQAVGILIDQSVVRDEGIEIDFLGRPAWVMRSPLLIAKKTGASVVPVFISRSNGGHKVSIKPPIAFNWEEKEKELVKKLHSTVEAYIKEHPTEWLWLHRRWKER